jgi:hypothetical protein
MHASALPALPMCCSPGFLRAFSLVARRPETHSVVAVYIHTHIHACTRTRMHTHTHNLPHSFRVGSVIAIIITVVEQ